MKMITMIDAGRASVSNVYGGSEISEAAEDGFWRPFKYQQTLERWTATIVFCFAYTY